MVARKIPKPRRAVFVIPVGVACILIIWFGLGWNLGNVIQGIGLAIDVVGVIVIAIPDIPTLHKRFFSGRLKTALNHLQFENEGTAANILAEPNTQNRLLDALYVVEHAKNSTVDEYLQTINVVRGRTPSTDGFYELREAFRDIDDKMPDSWDDVYGFKTFEQSRGIQSIIMREDSGAPKKRREGPYHMVLGPIERRVAEYETRIRLFGLAFLLIGFLFQFSSLFFTQSG